MILNVGVPLSLRLYFTSTCTCGARYMQDATQLRPFFYKTLQIIVKSIQLQNDESDECPVGAACRAQLFIYARVIVLTAISSCIFRPDPPGFHPRPFPVCHICHFHHVPFGNYPARQRGNRRTDYGGNCRAWA